jgi:hypothetical protein
MHPLLIVGAVLVGLPVVLHLLMKREPKRLLFPAVRFLQQKRKINQRKMRLRHLLLLLLRMLLIALFCAVLFQPRVPSGGLVIPLSGDQPVAAVFVLDTSPSMGYAADNKSRLDEARRRALELLDDLPAGSKVAVLDPAEPLGNWEQSLADARRRIESFREPHGAAPPVTTALFTAYQLLRTVDQESEAAESLPRLVAVFSDRTAECWQSDRADDLKRAAAEIPPPGVAHLFVDVGVEQPANVALTGADVRPAVAPAGQPVALAVTAQATGSDVPSAVVQAKLDRAGTPERKVVALAAGTPTPVSFTFQDLKPGLHQAEVSLETPDKLAFDNVRYVTFRVGESRKILTIADDPDDAIYWKLALQSKGEFGCDVKKPEQVTDFAGYDGVVLLSVADPTKPLTDGQTLWQKVRQYVDRGGKVLVIPGGELTTSAYDPANAATEGLLPGTLDHVVSRPLPGVTWALNDKAMKQPLLVPFREWKLRGNVDFLQHPRRVWKFWDVAGAAPESVVVYYDDSADPAKRSPAVLEKATGNGRLVLLTTRMDSPWEPQRRWNNYWETAESSWGVVFPNLLAKYLAGSAAEVSFNFITGQAVPVPLPKAESGKGKKLVLEGPGVTGRDAFPEVGERQSELRLPPTKTLMPGNYVLRTEDRAWQEGFSLNPSAEESNLARVPKEAIEAVFGPDSIIPAEKDLKLRDAIDRRMNPEIRLFPWLLIGVLLLFVVEGLVANRFYRLRGGAPA